MLECIASPQLIFCSSWWCLDTSDHDDKTSGHRSSPMNVRSDASTNLLVMTFSFTIPCVDPNVAGMTVVENSTQQFSWHCPRDDESILPIVTATVNTTICSIVTAAITHLPDPSWNVREPSGCCKEPNGDDGMHAGNVTPIFNNNTAAGWVQATMTLGQPKLCCAVCCGQQADGTTGIQTPMGGGRSSLHLEEILPSPVEDMIDDIVEESDDYTETSRQHAKSFPIMKTGFQMFKRHFNGGWSGSNDTLNLSETVHLVSFQITSNALLLMRVWLGYTSTMTL